MNSAEIFFKWLSVREGRGVVRRGANLWIAKDSRTGDVSSAASAERLAQILERDPELPKALIKPLS